MNMYLLFLPSNISVSKGIGTVSIEYRFKGFCVVSFSNTFTSN